MFYHALWTQNVPVCSDIWRLRSVFVTSRQERQSRNIKSDSSDSSCDDTILYLEDVDSDIGKCYADPEPLTGPQPYMHEPETVYVRVEDKHALSHGDSVSSGYAPNSPFLG